MNKEFVPYEQALALKELGFNETCIAFYYDFGRKLKRTICINGTILRQVPSIAMFITYIIGYFNLTKLHKDEYLS